MTNGNDLAHPEIETHIDYDPDAEQNFTRTFSEGGLTKREYFAALALNGYLSNKSLTDAIPAHRTAESAVGQADALIEALNK